MIRFLFVLLLTVVSLHKSRGASDANDSLKFTTSLRSYPTAVRLNQKIKHYPEELKLKDSSVWSASQELYPESPRRKNTVQHYGFAAITTGMWRPTGRSRILGSHPSIGLAFGTLSGRWLVEFELEARFIRTPRDYYVYIPNEDSVEATHHYFGYFAGVHVGYAIANLKSTSFFLLGGFGLDGFDAIDDTKHDESVSISSFNVNAGVGMQHYGKKGGYWGVELLYNITNYCNPYGTQLDGRGFTIRLSFGSIAEQ